MKMVEEDCVSYSISEVKLRNFQIFKPFFRSEKRQEISKLPWEKSHTHNLCTFCKYPHNLRQEEKICLGFYKWYALTNVPITSRVAAYIRDLSSSGQNKIKFNQLRGCKSLIWPSWAHCRRKVSNYFPDVVFKPTHSLHSSWGDVLTLALSFAITSSCVHVIPGQGCLYLQLLPLTITDRGTQIILV